MGGGRDAREAQRQGFVAPAVEFFGRHEAGDGVVRGRGREILAQGQERDARRAQVAQGGAEFGVRLAQAQHQAGLGPRPGLRGAAQDGEGPAVVGLRADGRLEAFDGFEVVVEDVGFGLQHGADGGRIALEIGHEDFDGRAG